jgi:hypothetical protein
VRDLCVSRFRSFATEEVNGEQVVRLTFLALNDCQLPLIPGLPCLRTTPLSFLLPMQQEGHYVAYIFPKYLPLTTVIFALRSPLVPWDSLSTSPSGQQ